MFLFTLKDAANRTHYAIIESDRQQEALDIIKVKFPDSSIEDWYFYAECVFISKEDVSKPPEILLESSVKEWYLSEFPEDDLGQTLNSKATFQGVYDNIKQVCGLYSYLGVSDSLIRERVFQKLAELLEVDYLDVYDTWVHGDEVNVRSISPEDAERIVQDNKEYLAWDDGSVIGEEDIINYFHIREYSDGSFDLEHNIADFRIKGIIYKS